MENKKFTICRVRGKEDNSFYDPNTDFRGVLPTCLTAAISTIGCEKDREYLTRCVAVFRVRLVEDHAPLTEQFDAFIKAIEKCPSYCKFLVSMFRLLMCVFALYMRRDAKMDGRDYKHMLNAAQLLSVNGYFDNELRKRITEAVRGTEEAKILADTTATEDAKAVCLETGEIYDNIKAMASLFVDAGGASWEELSKMCDDAFDSLDDDAPDKQKIALALAYPNYDSGALAVDMETDE